jgi:hypothetical protein
MCHIFCCGGLFTWDKVCHFGESVHYHQNAVSPLALGQFDDKIIRNFFPWTIGDAQKLKRSMLLMSFTPLTDFARVHAAIDLKLHGWPVVVSSYQLQGVRVSLMPGGWGIVKVRHHLLFQLWLIRNENGVILCV